jgi:hypothetical protein
VSGLPTTISAKQRGERIKKIAHVFGFQSTIDRTADRDSGGRLAAATLLATNWGQHTEIVWQVEHFLVCFPTALVLCTAWRRPYVLLVSLIMFRQFWRLCRA